MSKFTGRGQLIDRLSAQVGDRRIAIKILQESAPFKPFNEDMQKGYRILEIVRDWNFGG